MDQIERRREVLVPGDKRTQGPRHSGPADCDGVVQTCIVCLIRYSMQFALWKKRMVSTGAGRSDPAFHLFARGVLGNPQQGYVPSDAATTKLIYLAPKNITNKWGNPHQRMACCQGTVHHLVRRQILVDSVENENGSHTELLTLPEIDREVACSTA